MDLLREIYERDLGISDRDNTARRHGGRFWFSQTVVGVVYNDQHQIVMIHRNDDHYGLPAGNSGPGEETSHVLRLELDKLGAGAWTVEPADELGLVIEYRDSLESIQFAYGFTAHASVRISDFHTEADSILLHEALEEEANLVKWMSVHEAIALLNRHSPNSYEGKFIQARDLTLLKQLLR
ncbi:hypothetical protein RB620_19545 [Paenibacillus sp. LHD-117]|uniref:NUDIX hydrolase n=1 Tax=Paenibacillus sp. LHD-117 TaxID=3071412 RepID=UPI0027E07E34|nr:hypothetical protein [Paenibacillus sp. LHD-117]MDQ6421625.1 hypothetical protein [Paenibacillus sp. LHD-117]